MGKKKKSNVARAKLPLEPAPKYAAMVVMCKQQVDKVEKCSDYPNQPTVQAAAKLVLADANALDKTLTDLANAQALVVSLETQRDSQVATLQLDHDGLEAAIDTASGGDPLAVVAWGSEIATRVAQTPSIDAPVNPVIKTTATPGSILMRCKADPRAHSYLYQTGSDPAHPENWPAPIIGSGASQTVSGLTIGQKIYGRIAIVRRGTGTGQWSGLMEVTVR